MSETDILSRLRARADGVGPAHSSGYDGWTAQRVDYAEAATEITRLRATLAAREAECGKLREALEKIAKKALYDEIATKEFASGRALILAHDWMIQDARAALRGEEG